MLVDGPTTGVERQVVSLQRLSLTALKVSLPRSARTKTVRKVVEAASINDKWAKTGAAKSLAAKKIRANLSDFDRFKVMALRQKVPCFVYRICSHFPLEACSLICLKFLNNLFYDRLKIKLMYLPCVPCFAHSIYTYIYTIDSLRDF